MYSRSVIELVKNRSSVRAYDKYKIVEKEKLDALSGFCANLGPSPFGDKVHIFFAHIPIAGNNLDHFGTYGSIKNAPMYMYGSIAQSERCYESYGFLFEQIILKATDIGLSTCWLGYFTLPCFITSQNIKEKEIIPSVSPLGYASSAFLTRDVLWKHILKKTKRKHFSELFFKGTFDNPLDLKDAGLYAEPLELVRQAPSAGNKQPWRIVIDKDFVHFYIDMSQVPDDYKKLSLHLIDLGIALSHFELMCDELKIHGRYISVNPESRPEPLANLHYGISWKSM
jgi:hypothetical protein